MGSPPLVSIFSGGQLLAGSVSFLGDLMDQSGQKTAPEFKQPHREHQQVIVADSKRRIHKIRVEFGGNYNDQGEMSLVSWGICLAQSPETLGIAYHEPINSTNTDEASLYILLALPKSDSKKGTTR